MRRAISIILATLILLIVGYSLGRRPVSRLSAEVDSLRVQQQRQVAYLENRAVLAEAKGYLWQARAELLLASLDVEQTNFGTAADRARSAQELVARAAGVSGVTLDLTDTQNQLETAIKLIQNLDGGAGDALVRASNALGRILDERQA